jgi:hypothetical protein
VKGVAFFKSTFQTGTTLRGTNAGSDLLFQTLAGQVPSTLKSLTAVFGMGTGVTSSELPPAFVPLQTVGCVTADIKTNFSNELKRRKK